MTTTPTRPDIDTALAGLRTELGRTDTKAGLLLALTGAALAALVPAAATTHLHTPALATGSAAAAALLAATARLLLAVRPNLAGPGWPTWPPLADAELGRRVAAGPPLAEVRVLAATATAKMRHIRSAVHWILASLTLLATTAVLTAAS